jgi:co-chaperonin GroES (HSP10)
VLTHLRIIVIGAGIGGVATALTYSGSGIKLDGEEHLILREADILGVVEGVTFKRFDKGG